MCVLPIDDKAARFAVPTAVPKRNRVTFDPMVKIRLVSHEYPRGFFYTRQEVFRFRMEAQEERIAPAPSPIRSAFDVASSSMAVIFFLVVGMAAATIACLPFLLLLKVWASMLSFCSLSREDVDASVRPCSPQKMDDNVGASTMVCNYAERLLLNFLGESGASSSAQYEKQCLSPVLSN